MIEHKKILIFGCGGFGLEVLMHLKAALKNNSDVGCQIEFGGFVDNGVARVESARAVWNVDFDVFASLGEIHSSYTHFVIAVGEPITRERLYKSCIGAGLTPHTLIHPLATVCESAVIGSGCVVGPYAFVGPCAKLDRNVALNIHASVGHDAQVGYSSVISPYATLNGVANCADLCFMGTGSAILSANNLGNYSKLAAGSILTSDTEDGALAAGNPAKHRVMFRRPEIMDQD